jgi:hypothetical protein
VAKRAHVTAIDRDEYAFADAGIYTYRPNNVSGEVSN